MRVRAVRYSLAMIVLPALLSCSPVPAWAQQAPGVRLSPVELSVGLTINAVTPDVNTPPHCLRLSLPCTHGRSERFGGFGVSVSLARNLSDRFSIAGDVSAFRTAWDVRDSSFAVREATTLVTSFSVGPRISTGFFDPGTRDLPGRFFAHLLVGGETSAAASLQPALVIGGGADFMIPKAGRRAPDSSRALTLRWSLDYRISPGPRRSFSGYRLLVGVVFGPKLL